MILVTYGALQVLYCIVLYNNRPNNNASISVAQNNLSLDVEGHVANVCKDIS